MVPARGAALLGGHGCTLDLRVRSSPRGIPSSCWTQDIPSIPWQLLGLPAEPLWDSSSAWGMLAAGPCVELCGSAPCQRSCCFISLLCK